MIIQRKRELHNISGGPTEELWEDLEIPNETFDLASYLDSFDDPIGTSYRIIKDSTFSVACVKETPATKFVEVLN